MSRGWAWGLLAMGVFSLSLDFLDEVSKWWLLFDIPVTLFGLALVLESTVRAAWQDSTPRSPEEYAAGFSDE